MTMPRAVLLLFITAVLVAIGVPPARAEERQQVCAKYETRDGWSEAYKVNAVIATGFELNGATRSMDYDPISKYVVIFWRERQASVIKLDYPFLTISSRGTDQDDREWDISPAYGMCF